jgi:hypothetical protein
MVNTGFFVLIYPPCRNTITCASLARGDPIGNPKAPSKLSVNFRGSLMAACLIASTIFPGRFIAGFTVAR